MVDKERIRVIVRKFYKIAIPNILLIIGLLIPISLFHEFGHILVCLSYGYHFALGFDGMNFNAPCSHATNPLWLLTSMGGIFGTIGSLSPLIIRRVRNNEKIVVGLITLGFSQIIIGLSETFLNSWYLTNNAKTLLTIFVIIFLMIFLLKKIVWETTSNTT